MINDIAEVEQIDICDIRDEVETIPPILAYSGKAKDIFRKGLGNVLDGYKVIMSKVSAVI